jgi:predicted DNA-binding transcriptional regulator AlpA
VPIAVPLDAVMARVARHALDRPPPVIEPLLTLDGVAGTLAISRRSMERLLSSGGFPPADMRIGRMPRWRPITLRRWIEEQSREGVKR